MRHWRCSFSESRVIAKLISNIQGLKFKARRRNIGLHSKFPLHTAFRKNVPIMLQLLHCHAKYSNKTAIVTLMLVPLEFVMLSVTTEVFFQAFCEKVRVRMKTGAQWEQKQADRRHKRKNFSNRGPMIQSAEPETAPAGTPNPAVNAEMLWWRRTKLWL